jgi:hypothetical protein
VHGTLNGLLSLETPISASGELDITRFSFNNGIRIGHFDSRDGTGPYDFLGFQVAEPESGDQLRVIADIVSCPRNLGRTW